MAVQPSSKIAKSAKVEKAVKPAKVVAHVAPAVPVLDVVAAPEPEVVAQAAETVTAVANSKPSAVADMATAAFKSFPTLDALLKGMPTMTDTTAFTASTDKAQALFGDFNSRAKGAAEKGAKLVEELSELTKGNVEALVASGKIAAKGVEDLGAEAAAYSKASFEKTTGVFKSLTAVKSPAELLTIQSEFAKSSFDSMIAESSKLTESFVKLATEVMQPLSSRFAVAADKIKSASL